MLMMVAMLAAMLPQGALAVTGAEALFGDAAPETADISDDSTEGAALDMYAGTQTRSASGRKTI